MLCMRVFLLYLVHNNISDRFCMYVSHTCDRIMSEFKKPAQVCFAYQAGSCGRGDACRFSHEGLAGQGGKGGRGGTAAKGGKGGKGGKGKGGKRSQVPVDLGAVTPLDE